MLNYDCYITILETIQLSVNKMSTDSFKTIFNKMCLQIYLIYMYKEDLT